jgi:mevalonate kinase
MANYILKNKMWSDQKMNRLVKEIKTNAQSDREAAQQLFEDCKAAMVDLGQARVNFDDNGNPNVDAFTKIIAASTNALGQMGVANEKLLKLAQTMQKYQLKEMDLEGKAGPAQQELKGSFFSNLNAMLNKDKDAQED